MLIALLTLRSEWVTACSPEQPRGNLQQLHPQHALPVATIHHDYKLILCKQLRERHFAGRLEPVLLVIDGRRCGLDHVERVRVPRLLAGVPLRLVKHAAVYQNQRTCERETVLELSAGRSSLVYPPAGHGFMM